MPLLGRKSDEEKQAAERAAEEQRATASREQQARDAHAKTLTRWEYQVKRIGEDKQKGMLGSQRMESIFNGEGENGWELVAINEERATFKRQLPPARP